MAPDDDTPVHVPVLKYAELDDSFRVGDQVDIQIELCAQELQIFTLFLEFLNLSWEGAC